MSIDREQNEVTCPNCGRKFIIKWNADNQPFLIEENLYMLGEANMIPYEKKLNGFQKFINGIGKLINKYLSLKTFGKLAIPGTLALLVGGSIAAYQITRPAPIMETEAVANANKLWTEFRDKNPYNFQTAAIKSYQDKSHVIILSEPSEDVTLYGINEILEPYNHDLSVYEKKMGLDGRLSDVVICINGLNERKFSTFKSNLFNYLYKTDYKAEFLPFDSVIPARTDYVMQNLNYQISEEELLQWFVTDGEELVGLEDLQDKGSFTSVINGKDCCGLYNTKEPGFIVWVIKRGTNEKEKFEVEARKFALDADLILGAIANDDVVAVIGRERSTPVYVLPPMRVETMLMLASTTEKQLSQSYERNNIFAGKLPGGKDYAPIFLSDELWHTEYGSMLNVTDQMLKSWSENGLVEYEEFGVKKPYNWAFVESAMTDLEVTTLTYNWNTAGAGYVVEASDDCPYTIYAVNRTGSLPVSYIPGDTDEVSENDKIYLAEEKTYDFFSGLSNPELVKVVQYVSLYQIFANFDIKVNCGVSKSRINNDAVIGAVYHVLVDLCYYDGNVVDDKLMSYFDKIVRKNYYDNLDDTVGVSRFIDLLISMEVNDYVQKCSSKFDTISDLIKDLESYKVNGHPFLEVVAKYLVNPRKINYDILIGDDISDEGYAQLYALRLNQYVDEINFYAEILGSYSKNDIRSLYLEDNKDNGLKWIKCPTLVQSWSNIDSANYVGGHNLDSKITPIKIDKTLKQGQFRVDVVNGKKVVSISAKDKAFVTPDFLRRVERTNLVGKQSFVKQTARPIRPRQVVMEQTKFRTSRGFNATDHVVVSRVNDVFKVNGREMGSIDDLFAELSMIIENGEKVPCKNIKFENVSESSVRAIIDNTNTYIMDKGNFTKMPKSCYDISMVEYVSNGNNTVAKIRVKPENIVLKEASLSIEFPTSKLEAFKNALRDFFKNPSKFWNDFMLRQEFKKNKIFDDEIKELYELQVAHLLYEMNVYYYSHEVRYVCA